MDIGLFEDEGVNRMTPVALTRPAFAVSSCGWSLWDLVQNLGTVNGGTRAHLSALAQADYSSTITGSSLRLMVNAQLVPTVAALTRLQELIDSEETVGIHNQGVLLAYLVDYRSLPKEQSSAEAYRLNILDDSGSHLGTIPLSESSLAHFEYPHDLIRYQLTETAEVLRHLAQAGGYKELISGVFVAPSAKVHKSFVADTSAGPIVIDEQATVGPFCYMRGPVRIGRGAKVNEHAAIKDGTQIGPFCKVGGEIEACIIEAYSNKQHFGFLGHSYVGSWVNLGAGTTNSDLKNTYGHINMHYGHEKVATGMQFMGAIIGDYAKTAVNTTIFTGKVIGVGSMVYGSVTQNVPSFVNYAKSLGQVTGVPINVAQQSQARMFARRKVDLRAMDQQMLADVHRITEDDRVKSGVTSYEPPEF